MKIKTIFYARALLLAVYFCFCKEAGAADLGSEKRRKAVVIIKRIVPEKVQFRKAMAPGRNRNTYKNEAVIKGFTADRHTISFSDDEKGTVKVAETLADTQRESTHEVIDGMTIDSPLYDPKLPEYRIRTSDVLSISIPYEPDSEKSVPVRPDGRITYLFDIEIMAAGLTYGELNKVLRNKLSKYYKNPRVSVIGKSFAGNSVFVMGPVIKPGKYVIHNDTHLLDILSQSGAMSLLPSDSDSGRTRDIVNLDEAYLARGNEILGVDFKKLLVERDMSQNVLLKPRDFIYIPSSLASEKKIFVAGAIDDPGVIRYTGDITFIEAITDSGGVRDGASWSRRSYIIRGGVKNPSEIVKVNYPDIVAGRAKDIELQNQDIIYIPKNPLFYTNEVLSSVLNPLKTIIELDKVSKNEFTEGRRMYKNLLKRTKTKRVDH
ncbi:MAG: polysaccharide biosynthesis/export family protein [Planctomycetota bacterium]|jgi:polysaccharide export outer membrane protein